MKKTEFNLLNDLTNDLYRKLIDYAVTECKFIQLVVRKTIPLESDGIRVLDQLEPYLKSKIESREWPGTKLFEGSAIVFRYHSESECAEILKNATHSLYSWEQPNLPEDLCFLKDNEDIWLASITHEKDAYFLLSQEEQLSLLEALPEIRSLIKENFQIE